MPDKPRVKAPKQRGSQRRAEDAAKRRRLYLLGGGTVLAALVVAGVIALVGFGGDEASAADVRSDFEAAGCTLRVVPAVPNVSDHSDFPDSSATSPAWNTDPPTSGPHFGQTLQYNAYTEPIEIGRMVHNLEHGAAFILYGDEVPEATVAQLQEFYAEHRNGTILAPYPKLGDEIALGAWVVPGLPEASSARGSGILGKCKQFDEDAFAAFFDAFQFQGPESELFRPGDMAPGDF